MTPNIEEKIMLVTIARLSIVLLLFSCTNDPAGSSKVDHSEDINQYIKNVQYDSAQLLNVQNTGNSDNQREALQADTTNTQQGNDNVTCIKTKYSLEQNFEDIAILKPLSGVVYPGALIKGNGSLMDGLPEPISLPRAPVTVHVDLPGIGAAGTRIIKSPSNSSVKASIDSALNWWNDNAYQDGYVNASSSSYRLATSYSSQQLALDVGLNTSWATTDINAQFNYNSSESKKVMMAVYKQAFYTIDIDIPQTPGSVFAPSVTLEQVKEQVDGDAPAAYVSTVTYGRIIMFRMETTYKATSLELEAAFRYAAGYSFNSDLESTYKSILASSTIEVITLGGNAAIASEAVSARNAGDLEKIITGENAVYSKNNPGVPISYKVQYLKDHSLAKLGFTTEYTATECTSVQTANNFDIYIDWFKAIKDCDGGINGDGEFSISVKISAGNKTFSQSNIKAGNGDKINFSWHHAFKANRTQNNYIKVEFTCTEWDKNVIGQTIKDKNMSSKKGSIKHEFKNGSWTSIGNGTKTITLNPGNSSCSTSLQYRISYK